MSKVIILDGLDFQWDTKEIAKVNRLWKKGTALIDIAESVKRSPEETFLLLMDQARKGKIEQRENYVWGRVEE
jgi:hypothetical protein